MRQIAVEIVVEIRMRVEMQDGQVPMMCVKAAQNGKSHRVVAAQTDQRMSGRERMAYRALNQWESLTPVLRQGQVSQIVERVCSPQVVPILGP